MKLARQFPKAHVREVEHIMIFHEFRVESHKISRVYVRKVLWSAASLIALSRHSVPLYASPGLRYKDAEAKGMWATRGSSWNSESRWQMPSRRSCPLARSKLMDQVPSARQACNGMHAFSSTDSYFVDQIDKMRSSAAFHL